MTDILIACTKRDQDRVRPIIQLLRSRDFAIDLKVGEEATSLPSGLVAGLRVAKCVLVVWSSASSQAPWIRFATIDGEQRGILVFLHLDTTAVPAELTAIPSMDLSASPWGATAPETNELVRALDALLGRRTPGEAIGSPAQTIEVSTTRQDSARRARLRRVFARAGQARTQDVEAQSEGWNSPWLALMLGFTIMSGATVLWMSVRFAHVKSH